MKLSDSNAFRLLALIEMQPVVQCPKCGEDSGVVYRFHEAGSVTTEYLKCNCPCGFSWCQPIGRLMGEKDAKRNG